MTAPDEFADAIAAVALGAKVRFDAPPSARVALTNRDSRADSSRARKHFGFEMEFLLRKAVRDMAEWMRPHRS